MSKFDFPKSSHVMRTRVRVCACKYVCTPKLELTVNFTEDLRKMNKSGERESGGKYLRSQQENSKTRVLSLILKEAEYLEQRILKGKEKGHVCRI